MGDDIRTAISDGMKPRYVGSDESLTHDIEKAFCKVRKMAKARRKRYNRALRDEGLHPKTQIEEVTCTTTVQVSHTIEL